MEGDPSDPRYREIVFKAARRATIRRRLIIAAVIIGWVAFMAAAFLFGADSTSCIDPDGFLDC